MSRKSFLAKKPPWYFWIGLSGFLASHLLLLAKIEPISTYFFIFVWWSYIVLVDSLIFWIRGSSLFSQLRFKVLILIGCSYLFWEFFELVNQRIVNWDYIYSSSSSSVISYGGAVFSSLIWKYLFKLLAFGSVLPGVLETYHLLQVISLGQRLKFLGWERSSKFLQWSWWGRPLYLWVTVGLAMIIVSLAWSQYCFWMIWIALIFILDPDIERNGGNSIFSELRKGEVRTFYRLLVTGLVCGVLWEAWNYWAGLKWTYDVPFFFGKWKIFEMPLLGYLGFTIFAVECYVFYQWLGCQRTRLIKILKLSFKGGTGLGYK